MKVVRLAFLTLAIIGPLLTSRPSPAATVTFVGSVTGDEAIHWSTISVTKTKDIDGNNAYGTFGAVIWTVGSTGEQHEPTSSTGWVFGSGQPQVTNSTFASIDSLTAGGAPTTVGIVTGPFVFTLVGAASDYAGKTVRIGIMEDIYGKTDAANDTFKGLEVAQNNSATPGDSGVQQLRKGAAAAGKPTIYLFDLKGVNPGDQFTITPGVNNGGTSGQPGYVGPVFWDIK